MNEDNHHKHELENKIRSRGPPPPPPPKNSVASMDCAVPGVNYEIRGTHFMPQTGLI